MDVDESLARWLRVREATDVAARSDALTRAVAATLDAAGDAPVRVLDLGTGTGSNVRYLAERLPPFQHWLAVDRSAFLLEEPPGCMESWAAGRGYEARTEHRRCVLAGRRFRCEVETRQWDFSVLDNRDIFAGRCLVTASALLDLVSASWLASLAARCRAEGALGLFAVTYNGRFACTPAESDDEMVRGLMNRHQKRDKGFGGCSAGPDAVTCAERSFMNAGYRVAREPSDWLLGPADRDVQRMLIAGWAQAAMEMAPERASTVSRWQARRLAHVDAGRSTTIVCHEDLAAWPLARVTA